MMTKCLSIYLFILVCFSGRLFAQNYIENSIQKQLHILQKDENNLEALYSIGGLYLVKPDYDSAVYYGLRLQQLSYGFPRKNVHRMRSHVLLGQGYTMKGEREQARHHLEWAKIDAEYLQNDTILSLVYNGMGLYASNLDRDYYRSLSYFFEGMKYAKQCRFEYLRSILLANIAAIYYLKKDTAGLSYALECYERGHKYNNVYLIRIGSETASYMYYLKQDYETAMNYIKEAEFVTVQNNFYDQADLYGVYGMLLSAMGEEQQAVGYFRQALQHESTSQPSAVFHAYIHYADALRRLQRYQEAIQLLQQADRYAKEKNVLIYRGEFYEMYSLVLEGKGAFAEALAYRKMFQTENDSLFNQTKEQTINDLHIKYKTQLLESRIKEQQLEQLNKERKMLLMGIGFVAVLLLASFLFYLYKHTSTLYAAIVRQNQQAILREKGLAQQVDDLKKSLSALSTNENAAVAVASSSSLSNEKVEDLFNRLEELMREQRIYKNKQMTRETVSEMLGSNRTYLSKVVNDRTGKTFIQYVNEYRIREAVERLSNPNEDIPLKALSAELGFNSMTTFYHLFQTVVGMTPAQYRNHVQALKK